MKNVRRTINASFLYCKQNSAMKNKNSCVQDWLRELIRWITTQQHMKSTYHPVSFSYRCHHLRCLFYVLLEKPFCPWCHCKIL